MTSKYQKTYRVLNVTEETHFKVDVWRRALENQYGRRVTINEVVDYLADMTGPPPDKEGSDGDDG
jgi:hypothetical protein